MTVTRLLGCFRGTSCMHSFVRCPTLPACGDLLACGRGPCCWCLALCASWAFGSIPIQLWLSHQLKVPCPLGRSTREGVAYGHREPSHHNFCFYHSRSAPTTGYPAGYPPESDEGYQFALTSHQLIKSPPMPAMRGSASGVLVCVYREADRFRSPAREGTSSRCLRLRYSRKAPVEGRLDTE